MKIYPKILLITLPLIIFTALTVGTVSYHVSRRAVWNVVQDVLEYNLNKAMSLCRIQDSSLGTSPGLEESELARALASEAIKAIRFKESGYVFVVSADGTIIVHPDTALEGIDVSHRGWFERMSRTHNGSTNLILEGQSRWAVYATFAPWEWHIVSTALEDDLSGPISQMGSYTLVLAILCLLLAAIPLFILARRLVTPIDRLIQGTDSIRRGNLDTHLPITTEDEVGMLAGACNAMTARLRELITSLEDRNLQLQNEIGERRRTEVALRESEAKYRSIFDNAVEGIFQSTPEGRYLSVSPSFARMFGYDSPQEMIDLVSDIGRQIYANPQDRKSFLQLLKENGQVNDFVFMGKRKDGSTFWVTQYAKVVSNDQGDFIRLEGFSVDISAQKKAEDDREHLEVQLRQSQKMEALGNLTGGIAHDFNNLLQAMTGYVQLLLMKKDPADPDHKYLAEVNRAAARASDLVRRLLTFSRKMEVKLQQIDLNQVVADSLQMLERTIPKMIDISTRLDPELKPIHADQLQLEQVLVNLITNAVDAMPDGGLLVVETCNFRVDREYKRKYLEIKSGEYVMLMVSDTGIGMDPVTRERIFEPFFTTKPLEKGTGLGLATVYGIVKGHNGHITCYSEPDKGTTFKIYLPVVQAVELREASLPPSPDQIRGGTETILLVDDEDIILEIGEDLLTQHGYTVIKAGSGEEALVKYKEKMGAIDLVLLDLGMPGMGGERCLETLKAMDPRAKVIITSGYGAHKIAREPERFGAAGFLSKPYRLDELLAKARSILDNPVDPHAGDTQE